MCVPVLDESKHVAAVFELYKNSNIPLASSPPTKEHQGDGDGHIRTGFVREDVAAVEAYACGLKDVLFMFKTQNHNTRRSSLSTSKGKREVWDDGVGMAMAW